MHSNRLLRLLSFVPVKVELITDLRDRARVFLKLDLAYLAAAIALVTAFKIGAADFRTFTAQNSVLVFSLLALGAVDIFIEFLVFNLWFGTKVDLGMRCPLAVLRVLFSVQLLLHFTFASGVLTYAVGYSAGYEESRTRFERRVLLQDAVEAHVRLNGLAPNSFAELAAANGDLAAALGKLGKEKFAIEAVGQGGYKLTFAGDDGKIGTADDVVYTQALRMRDVYLAVERDRYKISPTDK